MDTFFILVLVLFIPTVGMAYFGFIETVEPNESPAVNAFTTAWLWASILPTIGGCVYLVGLVENAVNDGVLLLLLAVSALVVLAVASAPMVLVGWYRWRNDLLVTDYRRDGYGVSVVVHRKCQRRYAGGPGGHGHSTYSTVRFADRRIPCRMCSDMGEE